MKVDEGISCSYCGSDNVTISTEQINYDGTMILCTLITCLDCGFEEEDSTQIGEMI